MKRFRIVVIALLVSGLLSCAAGAKNILPSGNVSLDYWMAKATLSSAGGSGKADQNYFPAVSALFNPLPQWSLIAQYAKSGEKAVSPPSGTSADSSRTLAGVRRSLSHGAYVSFAYDVFKFNAVSTTPANSFSMKFNTVRIGGGIGMKIPATSLTVSLDAGVGLPFASNVKFSSPAASSGGDLSSEFDYNLRVTHKFAVPHLRGYLGYRGMKFNSKPIGFSTTPEMDLNVKGAYLGVGMDF